MDAPSSAPSVPARRKRTVNPGDDAERHLERVESKLTQGLGSLKKEHSFFGSLVGVGRASRLGNFDPPLHVDVEQSVRDLPPIPLNDSPRETVSSQSLVAGARSSAASSTATHAAAMRAVPVGAMPSPRTFEQAQHAAAAAADLVRGAVRTQVAAELAGGGTYADDDGAYSDTERAYSVGYGGPAMPELGGLTEGAGQPRLADGRFPSPPGAPGPAGHRAPSNLGYAAARPEPAAQPAYSRSAGLGRRGEAPMPDEHPPAERSASKASSAAAVAAEEAQRHRQQRRSPEPSPQPQRGLSRPPADSPAAPPALAPLPPATAPAAGSPPLSGQDARLLAALQSQRAAYRSQALEIMREREEEIRLVRQLDLRAPDDDEDDARERGAQATRRVTGRSVAPSEGGSIAGPAAASEAPEQYRGFGTATTSRGIRPVHRQPDDAMSSRGRGGEAPPPTEDRAAWLAPPEDPSLPHHRYSHGCTHRHAAVLPPPAQTLLVPTPFGLPTPLWGSGASPAAASAASALSPGASLGSSRRQLAAIHERLHVSKTAAAAAREAGVVPLAELRRAALEAAAAAAEAAPAPSSPLLRQHLSSTAASSFRAATAARSPPLLQLRPIESPQALPRPALMSSNSLGEAAGSLATAAAAGVRVLKTAPSLGSLLSGRSSPAQDVPEDADAPPLAAAGGGGSARVALRSPWEVSPATRQQHGLTRQARGGLGPLPEERQGGDDASEAPHHLLLHQQQPPPANFDFDGAASSISAHLYATASHRRALPSPTSRRRPGSPGGASLASARAAATLESTRELLRREAAAQAAHDAAARDRVEHSHIHAPQSGSSFVAGLRSPTSAAAAAGSQRSGRAAEATTARGGSRASSVWGGASSVASGGGALATERPPFQLPAATTAAASATAGRLPGTARTMAQLVALGMLPTPAGAGATARSSRSVLAYLPSQIIKGEAGGGGGGGDGPPLAVSE